VSFVQSTLEEFSETEKYDLIFINISWHEARDIDLATKNVRNALKPGGYFVISDFPFPAEKEDLRTIPARVMSGIQYFEAQIDDQLVSTETFVLMLEDYGFEEVDLFIISPGAQRDLRPEVIEHETTWSYRAGESNQSSGSFRPEPVIGRHTTAPRSMMPEKISFSSPANAPAEVSSAKIPSDCASRFCQVTSESSATVTPVPLLTLTASIISESRGGFDTAIPDARVGTASSCDQSSPVNAATSGRTACD